MSRIINRKLNGALLTTRYAKFLFLSRMLGSLSALYFFSFLPPIRRKCHRLILGNVTSGKLEHEYIAREGTPLLCDSRREFSLRWDSITGTALSSTRDFSEASFRAECAPLTLQVYSRGGGCGSHQNYVPYVAYRCLRFLASSLLGQMLSNATRNATSTLVVSQISLSYNDVRFPHNILPPPRMKNLIFSPLRFSSARAHFTEPAVDSRRGFYEPE